MIGATTVTALGGQIGGALVPFAVGVIAALVAYGRREWFWTAFPSRRGAIANTGISSTTTSVRSAA